MTARPDLDPAIAAWLEDEAAARAPERLLAASRDRIRSTRQRRTWWPAQQTLPRSRTTLAAALVAAVVALGGAYFLFQRGQPSIAGPQPTTSPSPSPSAPAAVVGPSETPGTTPGATPTATPGPTPEPLLWTRASMKEDWPAPVRPEPAAGGAVLPMPFTYIDPSGDTGSDGIPWVDIHAVMGGTSPANFDGSIVRLKLDSNPPPGVLPTEQWIAYGVVTDDDRDGVPDWRYGLDNKPVGTLGDPRGRRAWRTNLHTGLTESSPFVDAFYPSGDGGEGIAFLWFAGEVTGGGRGGIELDMPFYAWASEIQDGRVVATDYAPDTGWLVAIEP